MERSNQWYSLKGLAEQWKLSEERILEIASSGSLIISVYFEGVLHKGAGVNFLKKQTSIKYLKHLIATNEDIENRSRDLEDLVARLKKRSSELRDSGMSEDEIFLHSESIRKQNSIVNILPSDIVRFVGGGLVKIGVVSKNSNQEKTFFTPEDQQSGDYPVFTVNNLIVKKTEVERYQTQHFEKPNLSLELSGQTSEPGGDYLERKVNIEEFFRPVTWKTIKNWLLDYGVLAPAKGGVWRLKVSLATAIKLEKRSFIEKKIKNKK